MPKVVKPHRSPVNIFIAKDVLFFYEKILLTCESDRKSYGDEKILKESAQIINASTPFDFVYKDFEKEMQNPKDNVFYFSAYVKKQNKNKKYSNVVRQWYKHIRNAFAHNYIRKDNGAYVLEDYFQEQKGKPLKKVMYCRILSLDEFKDLIIIVNSKLK